MIKVDQNSPPEVSLSACFSIINDIIKNRRNEKENPFIITVSGASSGIGKTTVIEKLLGVLRGWGALKVTVLHSGLPCPVGRNCDGCGDIDSEFLIIKDESELMAPGKDTWRFKKAGAEKVLWLKARPEGLKDGIFKAISEFEKAEGVLIESTSVLKYIKPDLAVLVKKADSVLKPSACENYNKIDLILTV